MEIHERVAHPEQTRLGQAERVVQGFHDILLRVGRDTAGVEAGTPLGLGVVSGGVLEGAAPGHFVHDEVHEWW